MYGILSIIPDIIPEAHRIIIDVGINRNSEGKLCGDLEEDFKDHYSTYYTPVPKGVGPMTVAMLIENTFEAHKNTSTKNRNE